MANSGPIQRDYRARARRHPDTLTAWTVGAVLVVLMATAGMAATGYIRTLDDTVRRVTALETAFAALQSANQVQHESMLDGIERIETKLEKLTPAPVVQQRGK